MRSRATRLRHVEEERVAEGAELLERRQDVKRLEQDLVDAHQVVEAGRLATIVALFQTQKKKNTKKMADVCY